MIQTTAGTTTGSSIKELSAVAVALSKYLHTYHRGRGRAVKMDRLVQTLGFNIRQVRDAVKELRKAKVWVCSEQHVEPMGIWIGTREEMSAWLAGFKHRAKGYWEVVGPLEESLNEGQGRLF